MGIFLSTPSARRATTAPLLSTSTPSNFYPRPPRGGRQALEASSGRKIWISIHALREEGDTFSPFNCFDFTKFLSTPSARRATKAVVRLAVSAPISIHALREEGDSVDAV